MAGLILLVIFMLLGLSVLVWAMSGSVTRKRVRNITGWTGNRESM